MLDQKGERVGAKVCELQNRWRTHNGGEEGEHRISHERPFRQEDRPAAVSDTGWFHQAFRVLLARRRDGGGTWTLGLEELSDWDPDARDADDVGV